MTMCKTPSIRGLIVRLIIAVALTWAGFITALVHRVEKLKSYHSFSWMQKYDLELDVAGGTLVFMGLFLVVFFLVRLWPHLKRVAELGLDRW